MSDHLQQTIVSARDSLDRGACSSVELTRAYLDQIRGLNGALNAYISVVETMAMEQAMAADVRRAAGQVRSVLDGVPLAIKDNILVQGTKTTAGAKILENYLATNDATVIAKLKAAGAVMLGKTNMDAWAMGSSTERSAYGATKNPHDPDRVPGGSSGGSACAVAADMCVAALGSDTGGSVRQPAAFCGVVGLKPTYGRVSRSGLIAMASSLDQIGPLTKTVKDAALLFDVLHGPDVMDQTTAAGKAFDMRYPKTLHGVRIGLPRQAWGDGMAPEVCKYVLEAVEALKSLGAEVKEVDLPYADEALAVYYVLMPCEASANLARFDGMRYGQRQAMDSLLETYTQSRRLGLNAEAQRRILLGTYALSRGYYDAYYRQAKKVRQLIRRAYDQAFSQVDILLTATAPTTAFRIGEKTSDPLAMYLEDVFTVGVNVAGLPAVSVPCGLSQGLPVGMQLIGDRWQESKILETAYAYEQAHL